MSPNISKKEWLIYLALCFIASLLLVYFGFFDFLEAQEFDPDNTSEVTPESTPEATQEVTTCLYGYSVDHQVIIDGGEEVDIDGTMISVSQECEYTVLIDGESVTFTEDEFDESIVRITPPWCNEELLLGDYQMSGKWGPAIEVTEVNYVPSYRDCHMDVAGRSSLSLQEFVFYLNEENSRVISSYSFLTVLEVDDETEIEGRVDSNEYFLLENQSQTGFGTLAKDRNGNEYACFAPVCNISELESITAFHFEQPHGSMYTIRPWYLFKYMKENFPGATFVYPHTQQP